MKLRQPTHQFKSTCQTVRLRKIHTLVRVLGIPDLLVPGRSQSSLLYIKTLAQGGHIIFLRMMLRKYTTNESWYLRDGPGDQVDCELYPLIARSNQLCNQTRRHKTHQSWPLTGCILYLISNKRCDACIKFSWHCQHKRQKMPSKTNNFKVFHA